MEEPESGKAARQPKGAFGVPLRNKPPQGGSNVVLLACKASPGVHPPGTQQFGLGTRAKRQEELGMSVARAVGVCTLLQTFAAIVAEGFEELVSHRAVFGVDGEHHRLVDQMFEQIKDLVRLDAADTAHRLGGFEVPPSREH